MDSLSETIRHLESAATLFSISVDNDERRAAEEKIMLFRKLKNPYVLCFNILETSANECLLYEVGECLRNAVHHEWLSASLNNSNYFQADGDSHDESVARLTEFNKVLEGYIVQLVNWVSRGRGSQMSSFIRESILSACSFMIKLSCLSQVLQSNKDDIQHGCKEEISPLQGLIQTYIVGAQNIVNTSPIENKTIGLSMLHSLLEQFAFGSDHLSLGVNVFSVRWVRFRFERKQLPGIFGFLMQLAQELLNYSGPVGDDNFYKFALKLLSVIDVIVQWRFLDIPIVKLFYLILGKTSLIAAAEWRQFFESDTIAILFLKLHKRVRNSTELGLLTMSCLSHLIAPGHFNSFYETKEDLLTFQTGFLKNFVAEFHPPNLTHSQLGMSGNVNEAEALSIINPYITVEPIDYEHSMLGDIIGYLLDSSFLLQHLFNKEPELIRTFTQMIAQLTIKSIEGAALEALIGTDNNVCRDVHEKLLNYFVSIMAYAEINTSLLTRPTKVATTDDDTLVRHRSLSNGGGELRHSLSHDSSNEQIASPINDRQQKLSIIEDFLEDTGRPLSWKIFETYVQSHLADPHGFRNRTPDGHVILETTVLTSEKGAVNVECEENDLTAFKDGLEVVGMCGRYTLSSALKYVFGLLLERMEYAKNCKIVGTLNENQWVLEDLHWLFMITGHLIIYQEGVATRTPFDNHNGSIRLFRVNRQRNFLPMCLFEKEGQQETESAAYLFLSCLTNDTNSTCFIAQALQSSDISCFTKIVSLVMHACWLEVTSPSSSQIAVDLFWILANFTAALNIFPTSLSSKSIPPGNLIHRLVYSGDSGGISDQPVLNRKTYSLYLLMLAIRGLYTFSGELDVLEYSALLIMQLTRPVRVRQLRLDALNDANVQLSVPSNSMESSTTEDALPECDVQDYVNNLSEWWVFVHQFFQGSMPFGNLSPKVVRHLACAIAQVYNQNNVFLGVDNNWQKAAEPFKDRLQQLFSDGMFSGVAMTATVYMLQGFAMGALRYRLNSETTDNDASPFLLLSNVLKLLVMDESKFIELFKKHPDLFLPIMKLYSIYVDRFSGQLDRIGLQEIDKVLDNLVQCYCAVLSAANSWEDKIDSDMSAKSLVYVLRMLHSLFNSFFITKLLSKQFDEVDKPQASGPGPLVLMSLDKILPFITEYFLQLPKVSRIFFVLVHQLCDVNPKDVLSLANCNSLINMIRFAMIRCRQDVATTALEITVCCLRYLANHVFSPKFSNFLGSPVSTELQDTRQNLINIFPIIIRTISSASEDALFNDYASNAIFYMIVLDKERYRQMAYSITDEVADEQNKDYLRRAFDKLTPDLEAMTVSRAQQVQFLERFKLFLSEIRGLLSFTASDG